MLCGGDVLFLDIMNASYYQKYDGMIIIVRLTPKGRQHVEAVINHAYMYMIDIATEINVWP